MIYTHDTWHRDMSIFLHDWLVCTRAGNQLFSQYHRSHVWLFSLLIVPNLSPHVRESRTFLDSGFHAVDSGFRVLDSGFQHSGFRIPKRAGFQFFTVLMLFFAFRFRVRILLYWKTLLECITSLFSFSIHKLRVECMNVLRFLKGLWHNEEGDIGGLSTLQHRGNWK